MARARLSRTCEVLVAGAGPAGLAAAITVARYGIDVVLIDKRSTPPGLSRILAVSTRGWS
jgi:flavin-dependent dehydrogenase